MKGMKQKVSTIACVILLALQLNALVNAEEDRTAVSGSLVIGEGRLAEDAVIVENLAGPGVSGGDVSGGDVSGGDLPGGDIADESQGDDVLDEDLSDGDIGNDGDASGDDVSGDGVSDGDLTAGDSPDGDPTEEKTDGESKDVSSGNLGLGNAASKPKPVDLQALAVVKLQVPRSLDFVLDPWELNGKGSVWSQDYVFCNQGDKPIELSLKDIRCILRDGVTCAGEEVDAGTVASAFDKMVQLQLVLSNGDIVSVTENGGSYDVTVEAGEELVMTISGTVSNPGIERWQSGDVSISVMYSAVVCKESL